jgi:[acyl-carrier-protein] S-malonyltransferase
MKKIFVFPGQGSQFLGMGLDIYHQYDIAKTIFDKVDNLLQKKLTKIMFKGPVQELNLTENTQPALMVHSIALLSIILEKKPIQELCSYVAGHSVGEYSALCANQTIDLEAAAKLLHFRGKFMQEACNNISGAMAACLKINKNILDEILAEISKEGTCCIANDNSDGQIVISGKKDLIIQAIEKIKQAGGNAILLNVNGAFHSTLMQGAQTKMLQEINKTDFNAPKIPVIMNVSATPTNEPQEIKTNLQKQITAPVRWREIMLFAMQNELEIVEIGAGQVLSNLAKRSGYPLKTTSINDLDSVDRFISDM